MTNQDSGTWFLPETISPDTLIEKITKKYQVQIEPQPKKTVTYYDTFDWRLYQKKYLFNRINKTWHLIRYDSGERVATFNDVDGPTRHFAQAFVEEPLKTVMKKTLGIRSLLSMASFDVQSQRIQIFNSDQKTICHVRVSTLRLKENSIPFHTVNITGVRGYPGITKKLCDFLWKLGITESVPRLFFFTKGALTQGRSPGDYSAKFSITLGPDMPTRQAAKAIFKQLLATMRQNEAGIIKDIDSEFLHDFRVAMRRTRSGLTQMNDVLPPKISKTIKSQLADLGKITGPTRDLDIYLLNEQNYLSRLPGILRGGLTGFFTDMSHRRQLEWRKMVKSLKSSSYQRVVSDWQNYLGGEDTDEPAANSQRPVDGYARDIIFHHFVRIVKKGSAIGPNSPDEDLHRLRIQCKKLRYSLEFFASLFPKKEVAQVIRPLKRLQSHLGDFNDLSIQQTMLQDYLSAIKPGSKKNLKLAAAIGGLLTVLSREQREVRNRFAAVFCEFSGSKNSDLFSKLFH